MAKLLVGGGKAKKGSGLRRRYRGRMVSANGSPRSGSGGSKTRADAGFECGQTRCFNSKNIPGEFRVSMPNGRVRFMGVNKGFV